MPVDVSAAEKILSAIDRNELAQLGCELATIPSPTGQELGIATYILDWFRRNGLKAVRQDVEPGRPNAVGIVQGDGTGLSLSINGHTDTSYTGTAADLRMIKEVEPESELIGKIVGDKVQGLGISNMKGGVASFMMAGAALKRAGIKLKGDLILAAVVGEISRTPIGEWQSQEYRGEGIGTRHLLAHGMHSDYAICADGSHLNIVWAQMGVVQIKISVFGKPESAWGGTRADYPMEKHNAIVKMMKVMAALEAWGDEFEASNVYQSSTVPLVPKVNLGGIEGGAPYRPNYYPGVCSIYLDIRMPPQIRPVEVKAQVERVLNGLGLEYTMDVYRSLMGYDGSGVEPLVQAADDVYMHLFGAKPKPEPTKRASIWTDTNCYAEVGIPAIKIGPRGKRISERNEEIDIDAMVKAAQIYALMALDICMRPRK